MAAPLTAALLVLSASLTPHTRISTRLSWDGDVQRIVAVRCVSCHTPPQSGVDLQLTIPDLSTYTQARPWARAIREAALEGHGYSAGGGAALTPFERELLVQWIDGGAPETPKFFPVELARLASNDGANLANSTGKNFAPYTRLAAPDPLATLNALQARHGGTRTIVPGLGLALRAPDRLIVIDRGPARPDGQPRVVARGTLVPSLEAHLAALPASTPRTRVSDAAYVIGPLDEPRVEVAEIAPEGPDRFWCPMHPEVRGPAPGSCPRCGMALIEMPDMSLEPWFMDVVGATPLRLRVTRGGARAPVTSFVTTHERPFHLFVVDERLESFAHVHPEADGSELVVPLALPPGRYRLIGDFVPLDGYPQTRMTRLEVAEGAGEDAVAPTLSGSMTAPDLRAGRKARLAFDLRDATTDEAPGDLEPYLAAAAHMFIMDAELRDPMHAHPIDVEDGGMARPAFEVRFPRAGRYVMWLQVQRAGRVETLRFTVDVSS